MEKRRFDLEKTYTFNLEKIYTLEYKEICQLIRELFVIDNPDYDHTDLLIKVEFLEDSLKATFKICPDHILSLVHREPGKQLDS